MVRLHRQYFRARRLRATGKSITEIEKMVSVARSTVSIWVRDVPLTNPQRKKLQLQKIHGLARAREKAVRWHRNQKKMRLIAAVREAEKTIAQIDLKHYPTLELALAMLYMGEGFKKKPVTGLANSDPEILRIFINILKRCYAVTSDMLGCQLYLRADQNARREKKYWSRQLRISLKNFGYVAFDSRTKNSKTYTGYHGVCAIRVSDIAIQRKLISIGEKFAEEINRRA